MPTYSTDRHTFPPPATLGGARSGSPQLSQNSVVMQKILINKHKQQKYVQLSPRDTLADFILLIAYTAISIFCTLSIDKKWLCERQVCTVVGLWVGYCRLPWAASKIVWQAGIFLFPTRYIHTVGWITHKQIVHCKKWNVISGYHSCSSVPPYGNQRMCTQVQPTLTLLVIVDLWKENLLGLLRSNILASGS